MGKTHKTEIKTSDISKVIDEESHRGTAQPFQRCIGTPAQYFYTSQLRKIGLQVKTDDEFVFTLSGKFPAFRKFEELLRNETTPMGELQAELLKIVHRNGNMPITVLYIGQRLIGEQWNLPGKYKRQVRTEHPKPTSTKEVLEAIANSYINGLEPDELESLVSMAITEFKISTKDIDTALRVGAKGI